MQVAGMLDFNLKSASKIATESHCHFEARDRRAISILELKREIFAPMRLDVQGGWVCRERKRREQDSER
jgi:hypothetical protein